MGSRPSLCSENPAKWFDQCFQTLVVDRRPLPLLLSTARASMPLHCSSMLAIQYNDAMLFAWGVQFRWRWCSLFSPRRLSFGDEKISTVGGET